MLTPPCWDPPYHQILTLLLLCFWVYEDNNYVLFGCWWWGWGWVVENNRPGEGKLKGAWDRQRGFIDWRHPPQLTVINLTVKPTKGWCIPQPPLSSLPHPPFPLSFSCALTSRSLCSHIKCLPCANGHGLCLRGAGLNCRSSGFKRHRQVQICVSSCQCVGLKSAFS